MKNSTRREFSRKTLLDFKHPAQKFLKNCTFSSQTARLFYDQIKYKDYDNDVPSLFQNYSHCFFNSPRVPKKLRTTHENYRSITGDGNNLKYPRRGESFSSYSRLLKAQYDDNIHAVRKSGRGYELPSPRNIVRKLFLSDKNNLNKFENRTKIPNVLAVMFAQFIANDVGSRHIGLTEANGGTYCGIVSV